MSSIAVLLVEPHDDSRTLYMDYFQLRGGLTCLSATTIDEALKRAADADVVVTDIRLCGSGDGMDLIRQLRSNPLTRETPIIVLTAWQFAADERLAYEAGCDAFLRKPCSVEELGHAIHHVLMRRALKAARATTKPTTAKQRAG